jgi:hypothetical protein
MCCGFTVDIAYRLWYKISLWLINAYTLKGAMKAITPSDAQVQKEPALLSRLKQKQLKERAN